VAHRSNRTPSQAATRLAFGVIIVFVLAQVLWWIVFQERYIGRITRETLAAWQRDAATANLVLATAADGARRRRRLVQAYPHLIFDGERFAVNGAVMSAFERRQRGYLRMFAFEGPFFVLVILSGLLFIAASLRAERELKSRQQNFLSAITHEFKTPISTLRLLVETALLRPLTADKQRDYLQRMEAELNRLEATSEQVLASARLEQQEGAPLLAPAELNSVVAGILEQARQGLEARGARLEYSPAPEPLPVSLDARAFGVVINNLLDNAVKYSPDAEKRVRVRLERQDDLLLTHVEDEGVGISEGEEKRIFERFYRPGDEMTRESQGVGLGLHLVRSISEAMNGWVRVEPNHEAGRGTRFTVVLPRRVVRASDPEVSRVASEREAEVRIEAPDSADSFKGRA